MTVELCAAPSKNSRDQSTLIHLSLSLSLSLSLFLRFNGHFPGEPGLAGVYWTKDDGGGGDNWSTGAISRAQLQPNHLHQQTNIQFFYLLYTKRKYKN